MDWQSLRAILAHHHQQAAHLAGMKHLAYRIPLFTACMTAPRRRFALAFDAQTLQPLDTQRTDTPAWAALGRHQCTHCPLQAAQTAQCPAALRMADLLDWSASLSSFEQVELTVITGERTTTTARTSAQRAISSLMGLSSPHQAARRPRSCAPWHAFTCRWPTRPETAYRAASMYLLAQFFVERKGGVLITTWTACASLYRSLHQVNLGLSKRLREAAASDSSPNAVVLLDCFAQALLEMIDDALVELEPFFARTGRSAATARGLEALARRWWDSMVECDFLVHRQALCAPRPGSVHRRVTDGHGAGIHLLRHRQTCKSAMRVSPASAPVLQRLREFRQPRMVHFPIQQDLPVSATRPLA